MTGVVHEAGAVPMFLEDFRVGSRFTSPPRLVLEEDLASFASISGDRHPLHTDKAFASQAGFDRPILHGPFGIAAFLGWFFETGVARNSLIAMLDSNWRYLKPITVGDEISFEMTITRCRRSSSGDRGVVGRHVRVTNQSGELLQEGRSALLIKADGRKLCIGQEFFTRAWASRLGERLCNDAAFRSATATWDGTFAIGCDDDEVQLRVFKGAVLEAGQRSANGPAFVMKAEEIVWAGLFTGETNDLMKRAMQGQFSVSGSAYEYLRLTKALTAMIDVIRTFYREEALA
ncbi:MaoC/PaaZ C-terminal domain-containing protein [Rhizobium sp. AN80A]|uniref:MaoC/PaaZ C-terminal domain-containing protein n=1 Tax=Rhizobium sp. AN80A TaxID=3040673 RepID=UPI0024B330ED|nr:MaoC/PaaZ C-terminal domain-containing protein [Rhizobium sp. AN80A]